MLETNYSFSWFLLSTFSQKFHGIDKTCTFNFANIFLTFIKDDARLKISQKLNKIKSMNKIVLQKGTSQRVGVGGSRYGEFRGMGLGDS